MEVARSVTRDTLAISMGIERVKNEISSLEKISKKTRSVRNRLQRLYTAQKHLIESPKESKDLVQQLREINNG
tara:strand:- start:100 stop:318 length:219 start_codon:yes stop_codon:yes gene_type:complete